jgi:antitoxin component of MazEF toxin-antitoxin module
MKSVELKVARIGNSRGVRIPATTLDRYRIGSSVVMEERSDGILLRTPGAVSPKLSWEDTAREMAAGADEWDEWDVTAADGLSEIPWDSRRPRVAERPASTEARGRSRKR